MAPLVQGLAAVLIAAGGSLGVVWLSTLILDRVLFPARGPDPGRNARRARAVRPWLFLLPALAGLGVYLVHPVVASIWRSLHDRGGGTFVGLSNYRALAADAGFREALANSLLWVLVVPAAATFLGLAIAGLTGRLRWGGLARAAIFMPMAISFVGAALIWKFVYANDARIGLLNAVRAAFGAQAPVDVIQMPVWNSVFLMAILVWIETGLAMVILAAALRAVPRDTVEAAILDGAGPLAVFFRIEVPQVRGTILVVWTTLTLLVLKVFDIVYTMTGGNFGTEVLPSHMMDLLFRDDGRATAVAVVLMALVLPVLAWNVRQARREGR